MADVALEVYREAFRITETPALITDMNFVIRDVNKGGLEFTGYEHDEIVGQAATIISADDSIYSDIVEHLQEGQTWNGPFVLETKGGNVVHGHGSTAPVIVDGETKGFVAMFVDTTKQRQYENASEVLNRLLRHDLRNGLNVMYGYVQLAQSFTDDDTADEYLDRAKQKITDIVHKSERARDLRELLDRSSSASNHPVRLDIVLNNEIVDTMRKFEEAEFYFDIFPQTRVVADDLLSAALESVLENAVIHNDQETPVVEVDLEDRETDVVISIRDNGPGIPDGQKDLIFGREEFDQLHHGTGISLFFADNVIGSYNGDIWVEDNEPEGSVFKIRLAKV